MSIEEADPVLEGELPEEEPQEEGSEFSGYTQDAAGDVDQGSAPCLDTEREDPDDGVGRSLVESGLYNADVVNDQVFEELRLHPEVVRETQNAWHAFLNLAESPEASAEALFASVYDAAPTMQALFKTPRAVLAMKFMRGVNAIMCSLNDPKTLKLTTEALGFQHLDFEVTIPRVCLFRDSIVELIVSELGNQCAEVAWQGLKTALNYVGGALIFVRVHYASRLRILASSWAIANKLDLADDGRDGDIECAPETSIGAATHDAKRQVLGVSNGDKKLGESAGGSSGPSNAVRNRGGGLEIPTTFPQMFRFNAAVMGFGESLWMYEVLDSFDMIVRNVSNSHRLQEECDILALRLSKCLGPIDLAEFKAVMLAALRSLVPKGWDSEHEVAWTWLWRNVERLLGEQMGKPARQEKALTRLFADLEGMDKTTFRQQVYIKFFELAPPGQDYFKQSTTRLHFVADKVASLTLEMYRDPDLVVDELSACGLRHVGYGIPAELCGPFVCAYVGTLKKFSNDEEAAEAFEWSLSLISRIISRVINEGSTLVMRAINANSGKQLNKAVACAPRSKRAGWVLSITVGSQSISPLLWAVETGSLEAAEAIINDLLTIRADRDRYYYGVDALFTRHPDIIKRLCMDAPGLLPKLLDGLIWRSRLTENGRRRVVYFCRHLIVNNEGQFAQAIEWLSQFQDPKIICHPVISFVIDLVWMRIAARAFLYRKSWLLLTATVYMFSQSILNSGIHDEVSESVGVRGSILLFRCFIYLVSWPSLAMVHIKRGRQDIRNKAFVQVFSLRVPKHIFEFNSIASLTLCIVLAVMLSLCPILHCLGKRNNAGDNYLFTERCPDGDVYLPVYSVFSMCGMLCYWALLVDLSVFSNRVNAFALIFGHVLSEVGLFLLSLCFALLAFASATAALKEEDKDFATIPMGARAFSQMFLHMASSEQYTHLLKFPILFVVVVVFCFTTSVYMVNLLVAQLMCSYSATFQDMVGWARLKRGSVCVASMDSVTKSRWNWFVDSLRMDEPCEFGEGDIGMPGAIQMTELAGANVTTVEMIRRFGGSTWPSAPWPEDEQGVNDDAEERMDRLERLVKKAMKKVVDSSGMTRKTAGGSASGGGSSMFNSTAKTKSSGTSSEHTSQEDE